jgi:TonB-linked SusC/RagA family outer membrane protein
MTVNIYGNRKLINTGIISILSKHVIVLIKNLQKNDKKKQINKKISLPCFSKLIQTHFNYLIMKKKLLLGSILLLFCFMQSFAQERTITGKITSQDGTPLSGASVIVSGKKTGETTAADGSFSIKVPDNTKDLKVSFIGFETQTIPVAGQNSISVSLKPSNTSLNEIVVTGYGSQRKKDITGAVSVVDVKNLKQIPSGTTEALLQGQAAGVTVINSGVPGGGSNVRIRGITSPGNSDPLIIIDGVQGSMHDLNVDDIASMQVLKDAGAAAIYGVRASNGVIIITTKRGGSGKATISYDGFVGTQRPLADGFNIANSSETADAISREFFNDSLKLNNKQFGPSGVLQIPDYITPTGLVGTSPMTDPSTYALYDNQITKANKQGTDWFNEIFKPAIIQSHTVSAAGGGDKSHYYFSLGYFDQQGTLIGTYLKRYSARINTLFNVKNNIRVGENLYVFNKQNPSFTNQNEGNAISYSYRESPIIPIYDIMGNYAGTHSQGLGNSQNPVANQLRAQNNKSNNWQMSGNAFAEVDFLKHFTVRTSIGGTVDNYYYYYFNYTQYENAENNTNPNTFGEGGGYNSQLTWTNTLTYKQTFGKHDVTFLLGTEANTYYGRQIAGTRSGYFITNSSNLTVDPNLWTLGFGPASSQTNTDNNGVYQSSLYSQFGRLDYSYNDRYLLSGVLRRDGSSRFAPGHEYGYFPSFTAGWRISNESFFPVSSWLNDLKIRGGWGKLGSINNINATNPYNLYSLNAANAGYDIAGVNSGTIGVGAYASQNGNENTTWEQDIITNIGIDAGLFQNKLQLSFDWYKKAISGLLFQPATSDFGGGASPAFVNVGDIGNTGIDASLAYHGNINKDLSFNANLTLTTYNNKVNDLGDTKYITRNNSGSSRIGAFTRLQTGEAVGAFFGYVEDGLFQNWADVNKSAKQGDAAPGRFKFKDVSGPDGKPDGIIDDNDRTFFGNPNPKFTTGLNLGVNFKNFDFSTFLYASVGNDVINYVRYWTDFPQVFEGAVSKDAVYNSANLVDNSGQATYYQNPEAHISNPGAKVPLLERSANFSNTTNFNSYYMEDGSYLRMKSLIVGYSIPGSVLSRYKIEKFRIYLQATNLFTITNYTGLDPELSASDFSDNMNFGIDLGNYPANQKVYTVGVNVTF